MEAATQLLAWPCERVLRSQAALGVSDRAALLSAVPRFRRQAAAAIVGMQAGDWAGAGEARGWLGAWEACRCSQPWLHRNGHLPPKHSPTHPTSGLLYRYYRHKLQQLSEAAQAAAEGEGGDEAMGEGGGGGELAGGHLLPPGWGGRLQDVAAYLRMLGLEVRGCWGWRVEHSGSARQRCANQSDHTRVLPCHASPAQPTLSPPMPRRR